MKTILLICAIWITGCTTRGGWPRFLRPGEASDKSISKERNQDAAKSDLLILLARLDALTNATNRWWEAERGASKLRDKYPYYVLGEAARNIWSEQVTQSSDKACDDAWLKQQSDHIRNLAWLVCWL